MSFNLLPKFSIDLKNKYKMCVKATKKAFLYTRKKRTYLLELKLVCCIKKA